MQMCAYTCISIYAKHKAIVSALLFVEIHAAIDMDESMELSLLELLRCNICLEQVDLLKALPCQHTICLSCVQQLTTREDRFKCPTCNKVSSVNRLEWEPSS